MAGNVLLIQVDIHIPVTHLDPYIELLEPGATAFSWQLYDHDQRIHLQAIYDAETWNPQLEDKVRLTSTLLADLTTKIEVTNVATVNWLEAYATSAPPQRVGQFYIYGSHVKHLPIPTCAIPLWIDAATAFGSGEHATTSGCLKALEDISKKLTPRHVLDLGCGTGILGIAAKKLWQQSRIIASDIDPEAVKVTKLNVQRNCITMPTFCAPGFSHPALCKSSPYDVIIANILARPLCMLAPLMTKHIRPGGYVILSGLLNSQVRMVLSHYNKFAFVKKYSHQEWATLLLRHGSD